MKKDIIPAAAMDAAIKAGQERTERKERFREGLFLFFLTYISNCDILARCIEMRYKRGRHMEEKQRRVYIPMTETGFYILYCLQTENHGYGIGQQVKDMTGGEIQISPGTMYGTLSKMEKDGLIVRIREEEKRKIYRITEVGQTILEIECRRIERLYRNSRGEYMR